MKFTSAELKLDDSCWESFLTRTLSTNKSHWFRSDCSIVHVKENSWDLCSHWQSCEMLLTGWTFYLKRELWPDIFLFDIYRFVTKRRRGSQQTVHNGQTLWMCSYTAWLRRTWQPWETSVSTLSPLYTKEMCYLLAQVRLSFSDLYDFLYFLTASASCSTAEQLNDTAVLHKQAKSWPITPYLMRTEEEKV